MREAKSVCCLARRNSPLRYMKVNLLWGAAICDKMNKRVVRLCFVFVHGLWNVCWGWC